MNPTRSTASLVALAGTIALWLAPDPVSGQTAAVPARGAHGMVACGEALAAHVGVGILKRGGNAVDAAVGVGLALAVTLPDAGNLGGGGFMLIRSAGGKTIVLDYRETAPAAAGRTMYQDAGGRLIPKASEIGYRAVGVPGTVAGLALALSKYGTMKWRDVVEPARRLAAEGFVVSHDLEQSFREPDHQDRLARFPESRHIFLKDGTFHAEGDLFRQPELAATLGRLQEQGPRDFYEGRTARLITTAMKANGGLLTGDDLKNYKPVERQPLRGSYRGYEIVTMPPPSSGGAVLLEMLNMLEPSDVAGLGVNSSKKDHLLVEVMRRAFADRAALFGDTDFVKVPVERLITKSYALRLARTIDRERATPSSALKPGSLLGDEGHDTTHFSVVDAQGNAVANTYTLNLGFGSGVTVPGAGFLLNDEMDDFTSKPGAPNAFGLVQSEANSIAPHKRPLSAMTPTMVLKDGKLFLVLGSPGGPTIISTVLQVLVNVIDHGMNLRQAIEAPRLHHQWLPDAISYEHYGLAADVRTALEAKGQHFFAKPGFRGKGRGYWGDAEGIMIEPVTGMRLGACDPRSPDALAIGY